jgi:predicted Zn-dependent protease
MVPRRLALSLAFLMPLLCLALASACAPVVGTGRSQLRLVSDSELNQAAAAQYSQLLKETPLSSDRKASQTIKTVGARIAAASRAFLKQHGRESELDSYRWEFNLLESDEVNAFCMPGGKVAFYSGIMPVCQSEAGVAAVMGHEVAHAIAHHGSERVSQQMVANIGGQILGVALGAGSGSGGVSANVIMTAYGLGAQYGVLMPFSRAQESEADLLGLELMALAGYDPEEAVFLWQRMSSQKGGSGPPYFLSTHPSDSQRIEKIKSWLPEIRARYPQAPKR